MTFIGAVGLSLWMGQAVSAGPLQRSQVIAEPTWILHLDFDQLKQTQLGQYLTGEMAKPEAQDKFAAFQAVFNFDPRKDLKGLTMYGAGTAPEDGVLLVLGEFDPVRLTTLAKGAQDYESTPFKQYTINSWTDNKKRRHAAAEGGNKPRVYSAIHPSGVVVFGQKADRIRDALEVLDKAQPNLETNPQFSEAIAAASHPSLWAATKRVGLPSNDLNAAVFKQARMITLTMGEKEQNVTAELSLEANNEEVAQNIQSICQGLLALLALKNDNPDLVKLARSLSVSRTNARVEVALRIPSADVLKGLQDATAKKAEEQKP